jgi:hypothetical protein
MGLQSRLFRGDRRLEACLVHDASHITPGSCGGHVSKIQSSLFITDGADIDVNEVSAGRYGSSTAQAVLEFKRARKIINYSYQTQADDIVGKMTIAALDEEVRKKERPPGVLPQYPPRLHATVGLSGLNLPGDVAKVGELLWTAGCSPVGYHRPNQPRLIGDIPPAPGPLPVDYVVKGVSDFLHDQGLDPGTNIGPDSPPLYLLCRNALAFTGVKAMFRAADGTLRDAIVKAAQANSSGTCQQKYLDETRNGNLKVPVHVHWCGIYAVWVWRQAGALVYWKGGTPQNQNDYRGVFRESPDQFLGASGRLKFLCPGDIIVFSPNGGRNHHAIVTGVSVEMTNGVPDVLDMVEGNTGGPPETSVVKTTTGMNLASNTEEKQFYSVATYQNAKDRY